MLKKIIMLSLITFTSVICNAGTFTGEQTIQEIGCHKADTTCYINISGGNFGPVGCQTNSLRWNSKDVNGNAALSQLTAAFFAGKKS